VKAADLFSGGKESLYTEYLVEKQGPYSRIIWIRSKRGWRPTSSVRDKIIISELTKLNKIVK